MLRRVQVAVGLYIYPDRRVLLGQRKLTTARPGMWEYPGGKVEPGERYETALAREWREELGVDIEVGALLDQADLYVEHTYQLRLYRVMTPTAQPFRLLDHQALAQVDPREAVCSYPMVPGNYLFYPAVLRAIGL